MEKGKHPSKLQSGECPKKFMRQVASREPLYDRIHWYKSMKKGENWIEHLEMVRKITSIFKLKTLICSFFLAPWVTAHDIGEFHLNWQSKPGFLATFSGQCTLPQKNPQKKYNFKKLHFFWKRDNIFYMSIWVLSPPRTSSVINNQCFCIISTCTCIYLFSFKVLKISNKESHTLFLVHATQKAAMIVYHREQHVECTLCRYSLRDLEATMTHIQRCHPLQQPSFACR